MKTNTYNVFELEKSLIPSENWNARYKDMHPKCQDLVREMELDPFSQGGPIGIGFREDTGWFILCSGQGPFIHWIENDEEKI